MDHRVYQPRPDLEAFIKQYWTLEIQPQQHAEKQRIIPDGCIEMIFMLGDDIKRHTADGEVIIQPRAFILGQITQPFFIEPTGYVNSFAVRFYPYGFASFISTPLAHIANTETPLTEIFDIETAHSLTQHITDAADTQARIDIIEAFLLTTLESKESVTGLIKSTIDTILATKGNTSIKAALVDDASKRRQLERKFAHHIGISPKQLGKVVRLQAALQMMLDSESENLSTIAYTADYYDQAHFIKDFKEFTGITPTEFFDDEEMKLSSLIYRK